MAEAGIMISAAVLLGLRDLLTLHKSAVCGSSDPTDPKVGITLGKLRLAGEAATKGQRGQGKRDVVLSALYVSFVSLYAPSAGKNAGAKGAAIGKNGSEGPETNSPNSQTHTPAEGYDRLVEEQMRDLEEEL